MPRDRAYLLLREVDRGARLDLAWEGAAPDLDGRDRGWVQELVFGTTRLRGRLDYRLGLHLHRGTDSVPLPLLHLLRLGAHQLLYMGSVPQHAAVHETVGQARRIGGGKGAGVVNAVLRGLAARGGDVERFPTLADDPIGHLATWGSHPRWLVERWVERMGVDVTRTMVDAGNRIPALYLSPVGISCGEGIARLAESGIEASPGPAGTLALPPGTDPVAALAAAPGVIQDPAAAAVVDFVHARPGECVADLCAAPGGKGIVLAGRGVCVVAGDPSIRRLKRMQESLRRLGLTERLVVARAEFPPLASVDRVLVDAPCSGTGTLSRHPDARWRLTPEDLRALSRVQDRILDGAATIVREGGVLVYATCTVEIEENEERVEGFLARHPTFRLDEGEAGGAVLRILPGSMGTDGSFATRMRRVG
jgi:16S rRNA (cytosine967-C5)-methyltransferase